MGLSNLLASIAGDYTQRYFDRLHQAEFYNTPTATKSVYCPPVQPVDISRNTDHYEPSNQPSPDNSDATAPPTKIPVTSLDQPEVEITPDGTYYYRRQARLDYNLDLRFDLATFMRSVASLAEGDTAGVEQLAGAGFGLKAAFDVTGRQTVETNLTDDSVAQKLTAHNQCAVKGRQVGQFRVQGRDFSLQAFLKEAADIHRSLKVDIQDNHRHAVNRIALRYRLDNRFSFALAEKFNVQTRQMTGEIPDTLSSYFDTAGDIAEKGTPAMMAVFFDAVESYLNQTEEKLTANIDSFFNAAASELGFSGDLVTAASSQLRTVIENFFDWVTAAVTSLESKLMPHYSSPTATALTVYPTMADNSIPVMGLDRAYLAEA
ncbi:MAG: hypothetical protein PHU88_04500 [candidate division Zixibacteria bacterium]|nr:hypothetical protein [candidate division Zixibacteria bacterium]